MLLLYLQLLLFPADTYSQRQMMPNKWRQSFRRGEEVILGKCRKLQTDGEEDESGLGTESKPRDEETKYHPLNVTDSQLSEEYHYRTHNPTEQSLHLLTPSDNCSVCSRLPPPALFGCLLLNLQSLFAPGSHREHKRISL